MNASTLYPEYQMQKKRIYPNEYYISKSYSKTEQRKRFRKYCTRLCKESLITGFPVIVSTRNPYRRVMKALVFCVCICGFLYQTTEFLQMYLEYPTMVDIQIENPDSVQLPSIGFCNRNRIRRKEVCRLSPEECIWSKNRSDFCFVYPRYCVKWARSDEQTVLAVPDVRKSINANRTFEYNSIVGQSQKDLIDACVVKTEKVQKCENWLSVPAVNREGFPNTCFNLESLWGNPEGKPKSIPVTGQISVKLSLHPEESMNYYDLVQAHILAHDPHAMLNPIKDGISLQAGKTYNLYISQILTERLPAPYETNCTDYLKLWKENGGKGPLTGKSCAEKCKMEKMLQKMGCVPQSIAYPNNNTLCESSNVYPTLEIVEGCSRECSEACYDVTYNLRTEVKADQSAKSVGVFSYIGGYIGMWLGISLVALFDFLETLFHLLSYPYTEWRANSKVKGVTKHI